MKNVKATNYWRSVSGDFNQISSSSEVETFFLDENGNPVEDGENVKTVRIQVKDFSRYLETQKAVNVSIKEPLVFKMRQQRDSR